MLSHALARAAIRRLVICRVTFGCAGFDVKHRLFEAHNLIDDNVGSTLSAGKKCLISRSTTFVGNFTASKRHNNRQQV